MAPGDWWDDTPVVDNGLNPTTDLPWGVYPDKGSPTGYTHTASGTPVYKDGSPWSGTTSDRAINVNVAAPVTWGPSQTDDGSVTGVPGAVYQTNSRGDISIISKPSTARPSASLWNDENSDGYDDQTGLPNGVTSIGGKLYFQGKRVNPDGSLYTGTDEAKDAPTWTGYGPRGQGTYRLDGPGGTPGTYIGPTTAAGAGVSTSSGGGSSGGSSGGGSSTRSGGYDNTTTSIHEGGYTNTNISDVGPGTIAENAKDRAIRAAEFAATYGLQAQKAKADAAATYAQNLMAYDPNAFQAWLREKGGGALQNAIGSGTDALSPFAIQAGADALDAVRGFNTPQGLPTGGLGTGSSGVPAGGGDPTSPGAGGGQPTTPAAAPVDNVPRPSAEYMASLGSLSRDQVTGAPELARAPGWVNPLTSQYQGKELGLQWNPGTQTMTSTAAPREGYLTSDQMNAMALGGVTGAVDPRIAAQAGDDIQRDLTLQPRSSIFGTGPMTTAQVDANGNLIVPGLNRGGIARGPAIIGDPQADGRANPEVMVPEDPNMKYRVMPLKDMPNGQALMRGGLPRHAYGTFDGGQLTSRTRYTEPVVEPLPTEPTPRELLYSTPPPSQPAPAASAPASNTTPPVTSTTTYGGVTTGGQTQQVPTYTPPVATPQPQALPSGGLTQLPGGVATTAAPATTGGGSSYDEVAAARAAAQYPWMNDPAFFMNTDYWNQDPIVRGLYESGLQFNKGIPIASTQFAAQKNRLGGISRNAISIGY